VNDKVKVIAKRFYLRLVSRLDRIFDRQVMELEYVRKDIDGLLHLLSRFSHQIDPQHIRFVRQQLWQLIRREAFLDLLATLSINENFHDQCVDTAVNPDSANK